MKRHLIGKLVATTTLLALALFLVLVRADMTPARADVIRNLLVNGDFARGSGDSVDGWRTDAWILTAGTTD